MPEKLTIALWKKWHKEACRALIDVPPLAPIDRVDVKVLRETICE